MMGLLRVTDVERLAILAPALLCCLALSISTAFAEEVTAELLTAETVRSDYEAGAETWASIPAMALNAVMAAEDPNFLSNPAQNSTITVQLGKRYITTARRSVLLKTTQYHNAMILARELTHDEILGWYSHEIWLGHGCNGFPDAAKAYFGKDVSALATQEFALLAAIIKSPQRYDPARDAERATEARNRVIDEMARLGELTPAEAFEATAADLGVRLPLQRCLEQ
jgi:membrane carboxypeptidase/penicillin-binding protein